MNQLADRDCYFDLKGLAQYCSLSIRTLRDYLKDGNYALPHFRLHGKILVRKSEFDRWVERFRADKKNLDKLVDEVVSELRGNNGLCQRGSKTDEEGK